MKTSDNKIRQLLLEKNKNNHEASRSVECQYGVHVEGGNWVEEKDFPNLTKLYQPVYMDEKGALLYPMTHDLIIGSTGSGKTTVLYDNYIDYYSKLDKSIRPSLAIVDIKGDMYTRHAKKLMKKGYKVHVMDMRNPYFSACYNPLAVIYENYRESNEIEKAILNGTIGRTYRGVTYKSVAEANKVALGRSFELKDAVDRSINELVEIMIINADPKNLSWTMGGRNCLKAIMYTLLFDSEKNEYGMTKEKYTLSNVLRTAFNKENDYDTIIKWLKRAKHIQVVEGALSSVYELKANVTRDGYVSSMTAELNKYSSHSISALTSKSDISISDIAKGEEDHAVFLITDSRVQATNAVAMMFINDLINALVDVADRKPARMLDKDFVFLADEMGNMPNLPNMCNKITTLRSRKIWMHMSVQSLEQFVTVYGKEIATTILDNCDTHFFLGCNNQESKEQFAKSLGKKIGIVTTANIQGTGEATATMSTGDVPLVKISDLEKLVLGEYYVRSRMFPSLKASMIPYFRRTDVDREEIVYNLEYNGYEPETNVYFIENVLIEDKIYDSYSSTKNKKRVPQKSSLMTAIRNMEKKEKENNTNSNDVFVDDGTEFVTDIERNLPSKSFYSKQVADDGNIACNILNDMKRNTVKTSIPINDKIIDVIALGILPSRIQKSLIDISIEATPTILPSNAGDWLAYFKYYLLMDKRLKQSEGKQATLKEMERRLNQVRELKYFSEKIVDAYDEVKNCIEKMTDTQFAKYCKKVLSQQ